MTGKRKMPLNPVASLLVVTGMATMMFSGGCSLFMFMSLTLWPLWPAALLIGGGPFLLGGLTFWLASKYGREKTEMSVPEEDT